MQPFQEPLLRIWTRRAVSIPAYVLLFLVAWLLLPIALIAVLLFDLLKQNRFSGTRALLFALCYLCFEIAGLIISAALWIVSGVWMGLNRERHVHWNTQLQWYWGSYMCRVPLAIFSAKLVLEDAYGFDGNPVLIFCRHASMADVVLAAHFVSARRRYRVCYVVKEELLWDPCIDVNGHRVPMVFVDRYAGSNDAQLAHIRRQVASIDRKEGILIYPEGTRFTQAKRERIIQKFRESGDGAAGERAASLRHVLPPRLGGAMALLENNPGADAVFCAHAGLEKTVSFSELLNGGLVGTTVYVKYWGVPYAAIPTAAEAREEWLFEQWRRIDAFVAAHVDGSSTGNDSG